MELLKCSQQCPRASGRKQECKNCSEGHYLDWSWQELGQQAISVVWVTLLVLGNWLVENWLLSSLNPGGFVLGLDSRTLSL